MKKHLFTCVWLLLLVLSAHAQGIDFLASTNSSTNTAKVLLGRSEGAISGNVQLILTNIPSYLVGSSTVHVLTERIPDNGTSAVSSLTTVVNADYPVTSNSITITLASMSVYEGYVVTLTPGSGGSPPSALSTTETLTINMALDGGAVTYKASGFLHSAMLSTTPSDAFVTPMKPKLWRCAQSALAGVADVCNAIYARATALGAAVQIIVSDHIYSAPWPGDGGSWTSWENRCASKVNAAVSAGRTYQWDIWNEPTGTIFWNAAGGQAQFFEAWKRCVNVIRGILPGAVIVGPSVGPFEEDETWIKQFLTYAQTNSVLPNILSWHEFETDARRGSQIPGNVAAMRAYLTANGIGIPQIQINEVILEDEYYSPGKTIRYLANIERTEVVGAVHACWADTGTSTGDNCFASTPNLNGLLTVAGNAARGSWWAYKAYGELSGRLVGFGTLSVGSPTGIGEAGEWRVLDDFTTQQLNGDGSNLFETYFAGSENPNQTVAEYPGTANKILSFVAGSGDEIYWHFYPYSGGYLYPKGYLQNYMTGGAPSSWANANRMQFLFRPTANKTRRSDGGGIIELGTYIRDHANATGVYQGQHYYHIVDPNLYANKWHLVVFNRTPQHKVASLPGTNWGNDPEASGGSVGLENVHYYDGMTRFYFDSQYVNTTGETWSFKNFEIGTVTGTEDAEIASIVAVYSGTAYEISWASVKNSARTFDVRYSTSGSMKTNGFTSGTSGGTASNPASDYTGTFWASPAMAEANPGIWVAIRRQGATDFTELWLPYQMIPSGLGNPRAPSSLRVSSTSRSTGSARSPVTPPRVEVPL